MFKLENILTYASSNIQIIGIFIAIIGGLLVTKLINLKIDKETLQDKLNKINREIRFYRTKNAKNKDELYKINRIDYIEYIYEETLKDNFNVDNYQDYGLTKKQRENIVSEIKQMMKQALEIFRVEHTKDEIPNILKKNGIIDGTIEYEIYNYIGKKTRKRIRGPFGQIDPSDLDFEIRNTSSIFDNLEERDLSKKINEYDEFLEWKRIEKEDIESKLKSISNNLNIKHELYIFVGITLSSIVFPQIVLTIYPLFYGYKTLKYIFAIYSVSSFLISMIVMLLYIIKLLINIKKQDE